MYRFKEKLLNRVARTRPGKSLFGALGGTLDDKRWVFILGCYNSGTTLLNRIMLAHPDIGGLPGEGVAFTDVILRPEEFGWTRMWWKCREEVQSGSNYTVAGAKRLKAQWSWLLDKPDAPIVLEKSIVNVLHARFFKEYFNRPKFIHLVRNGYAVSEGIRRKAVPNRWDNPEYSDRYPIDLCARQWVETLDAVDELKRDGLDLLEVSYEDLSHKPDAILQEIFEFIGVGNIQRRVGGEKWLVHGKNDQIRDMNPKSIRALSIEDRAAVYGVAAKWIDRYGYKAE